MKNPFGYDPDAAAFPQLLAVLGFEKRSQNALNVKQTLNKVGRKCLNLNKTPKDQPNALVMAEKELKEGHPDLYGGSEGAKALYIALRVIMYTHGQRRSAICQRNKLRTRDKNTRMLNEPGLNPSSNQGKNNDRSTRASGISTRITFKSPSSSPNGDMIVCMPRKSNAPSRSSIPAPKDNTKLTQTRLDHVFWGRESISAPGPITALSRSQAICSSGPELTSASTSRIREPTQTLSAPMETQGTRKSGITTIHKFLSTCQPSMDHFLYRFIDFGCKSEEYLSSLAAWHPEKRFNVLKKILSDSDGTAIGTDMDIEVLQQQFETYFL